VPGRRLPVGGAVIADSPPGLHDIGTVVSGLRYHPPGILAQVSPRLLAFHYRRPRRIPTIKGVHQSFPGDAPPLLAQWGAIPP